MVGFFLKNAENRFVDPFPHVRGVPLASFFVKGSEFILGEENKIRIGRDHDVIIIPYEFFHLVELEVIFFSSQLAVRHVIHGLTLFIDVRKPRCDREFFVLGVMGIPLEPRAVNDGATQGNIENRAKKQEKEDVNEKAYGIPEDSRGLDVRRDFGSAHDQETTIAL